MRTPTVPDYAPILTDIPGIRNRVHKNPLPGGGDDEGDHRGFLAHIREIDGKIRENIPEAKRKKKKPPDWVAFSSNDDYCKFLIFFL